MTLGQLRRELGATASPSSSGFPDMAGSIPCSESEPAVGERD